MQVQTSSGTGDMAQVCGLFLGHRAWTLVFARAHFIRQSGAGTDTADLTISVHSVDPAMCCELYKVAARGVGADMNLRIPVEERDQWIQRRGDGFKFSWTNPDAGEIRWGLQVGLQSAAELLVEVEAC